MSTVSPAITSIAAPVTGVISWVHTGVACSLLTGRRHRLDPDGVTGCPGRASSPAALGRRTLTRKAIAVRP